ncbi:MAG TPA: hypothetical protein VHY08_17865 [Bacillota bacterium]|nr:hypothetical protein [Bacillota bacterium]
MARSVGCYYCFKTLNPADSQPNLRSFVKCRQCGRVYHATCWALHGQCLNCEADQIQPVTITPPARLRPLKKKQALFIKPSAIYDLDNELIFGQGLPDLKFQYLVQIGRAILMSVILLLISALLGTFIFRMFQLNPIATATIIGMMNQQFLPPPNILMGILLGGAAAAMLFYKPLTTTASGLDPKNAATQGAKDTRHAPPIRRKNWLLLFGTAILIAVLLDFVVFGFSLQDMLTFKLFEQPVYLDLMLIQLITLVIVSFFTPLHRKIAPFTLFPKMDHSRFLIIFFGVARLLICNALNLALSDLSVNTQALALNEPRILNNLFNTTTSGIPVSLIGAGLIGLALSLIFCWPPKFSRQKWTLGLWRTLIVASCALVTYLMYCNALHPDFFLKTIIFSSIVMSIIALIQYILR